MRALAVTDAEYLIDHQLKISFSDGTSQIVDFGPFLIQHPHPQHDKYRHLTNFKKFKVERGNVVWGKDWDLIFPISELHKGNISPAVY
ncbi:DUF2442 domain-containing protein [Persicitalea sp.]|uniref:DUF2442 domain-containing protein n=1 Tax=Persicitalea sp. TaxID=3100273 RepID=UPI0035935F91